MSDSLKQELVEAAANVDLCPYFVDEQETQACVSREFHLEDLAALGVGFETVKDTLINVLSSGTSGIYRVTVPAGGHLAESAGENIGAVLSDETNKIIGQARLDPIDCDPTMLFMGITLMSIQMKLDEIEETQEEILDFLVQKEKASLRGNLHFLMDAISNYKYNWNNEQYKNTNYVKALDIRQESEKSILLARQQIEKALAKKELIETDQSVAKKVDKLKSGMSDYQLAVYLVGLSYYAEILFQGNFDSNYLKSITDKMDQYSYDYRVLYTKVYEELSKAKNSAIQGVLLKGVGNVGKGLGSAIGKVPIVNKGKVDELMQSGGDKLKRMRKKQDKKELSQLLPQKSCNVEPFINTLDMIDDLYNKPVEIAVDRDNLYVLNAQEMAL